MRRAGAIIGTTVAIFVGLILLWVFTGDQTHSDSLTEITDPSTIQNQVSVSRIGIATGENYIGHKIRVIGGNITNNSERPLRLVDLKLVFLDYEGKPLQEHVERAIDVPQKPVVPGGTYRFEINFENLPRTWNYRIPTVEIIKVGF